MMVEDVQSMSNLLGLGDFTLLVQKLAEREIAREEGRGGENESGEVVRI